MDKQIKRERFRKIISFEDPIYTIKTLIYVYLLMKLAGLLGDRFILFVVFVYMFFSSDKASPSGI